MRAAVLTVSDSSARGLRRDESGPRLVALLKEAGWDVVESCVLPDEASRLSAWLADASDSGRADLILTTGGTGLGPRDVTPEATRAVIDREVPGLPELMRAEGLRFTPMAALSRAVAGTRRRTLIVNLPGSPQGAEQSLRAILHLLAHAVALLMGDTAHPAEEKRAGDHSRHNKRVSAGEGE